MGHNVETTGHKADRKEGFFFLGNQLTLDFLNTRPVQEGQAVELLPDFDSLSRWFHAAGHLSFRQATVLREEWSGSERSLHAVEALRRWREKLRKQVHAWEHGGSIQHSMLNELNSLMAAHPMRFRLSASGRSCATELWFEPRVPEDLFAPLAQSAADLFATADRKRVRQCARCVLHFQDTSKKGTRRWCSMQLCGNRLKVAAYAARHRKGKAKVIENQ